MHLNRRRTLAAGVCALVALSVAACSSGTTKSSGASAAAVKKDIKVVVVSGPLTDPFFSAIKAGTAQAGKDLGVDVQYTAPSSLNNLGPDLSRLEDAAMASKPTAVVASEFLPDAQDPSLKKITAAGIPLVFMNAGPNWQSLGGLTFIGEDPTTVGLQAGEQLSDDGAKKVLCVIHVPGNPTLEARCKGLNQALTAAGGTTKTLTIPADQSSNPTAVSTAISGALRSDKSIDGVFTLGSGIAEAAAKGVKSANSTAMIGTTDLSKNVLALVKDGTLKFTVDQQPFLQGYYAILAAAQKVQYGIHPIGQVKTSPLFITKDNVDETITLNDENNGIRGAS